MGSECATLPTDYRFHTGRLFFEQMIGNRSPVLLASKKYIFSVVTSFGPTQEYREISRTRTMNSPPSKSQDTGLEQSSPTEGSSLLTEDAFCSERSQQLFEAIDELQSCGASRDIDLPEVCKCRTVSIKSLRLTRLACHRRRPVSWKVVAPAKLD